MEWGQFVIFAIILLFLIYQFGPVKGLTNINADTLKEKMKNTKNMKIVDVREPAEFSNHRIPGAINIPLSKLSQVTEKELKKDDAIVLVCLSGTRSKQAGRKLVKQGYKQLYNLSGGMMRWKG